MADIYAFTSQSDIDRVAQSVRVTESRFISNGDITGNDATIYFAEITEVVDDTESKQAKGEQVVFDAETGEYTTVDDGWIFDDDDESENNQGDIYSPNDMAVGDVVQIIRYTDESDTTDFIAIPIGGAGAQRPIIQTAGVLEFGAILDSIIGQNVEKAFTEITDFRALMPWGEVAILPDDFVFTADIDSTGIYYTEAYPTSMWAIPTGSYPSADGYTVFKIYDSPSDGGNVVYDSSTATTSYNLVLDDFDFGIASTASKAYYAGLPFPCSFDAVQQKFYFFSPVVK